jgi:hypothetical protein
MLPEYGISPPRRPWLPKPSDRFSTDSQDLSAAEIIKARSTTLTPAVRLAASQAIDFSRSTRQPGIQPSAPMSRPPLPSVVKKPGTGSPSDITSVRSNRMKPLPIPTPSTSALPNPNRMKPLPIPNPSSSALPNPNRLSQGRPRRGAMAAPQTSLLLSREASNPSTGGTSITLQGQQSTTPVSTDSTISSMPGTTRAASKDKDQTDQADSRSDTPSALPALPPLPELPALPALPAPAPVGIARILAEMTDEVENGERAREKKSDTRKLRTPPFPAKRLGPTRSQRF